MNNPALNQQSDMYMRRRDFRWKRHGSKRSNGAITTLGPWSMSQMLHAISYFLESEEMHKGHMHGQQQGVRSTKKKTLNVFPDTPTPPPHESKKDTFFASTSLRRQCTPIKRGSSHKSPALSTDTSWSFTMSTATLRGQRPSSTTPLVNLSWPVHEPWSKCKRWALSQNTKSWTTKHQWHTRRPLATPT
jgi:hypothetical protein